MYLFWFSLLYFIFFFCSLDIFFVFSFTSLPFLLFILFAFFSPYVLYFLLSLIIFPIFSIFLFSWYLLSFLLFLIIFIIFSTFFFSQYTLIWIIFPLFLFFRYVLCSPFLNYLSYFYPHIPCMSHIPLHLPSDYASWNWYYTSFHLKSDYRCWYSGLATEIPSTIHNSQSQSFLSIISLLRFVITPHETNLILPFLSLRSNYAQVLVFTVRYKYLNYSFHDQAFPHLPYPRFLITAHDTDFTPPSFTYVILQVLAFTVRYRDLNYPNCSWPGISSYSPPQVSH